MIQHGREAKREGRRTDAATPGLPEVVRRREPWCEETGATRDRRTVCVVQLSAFPMPQTMLRRGGGGNITGSDVMWVNGRVQPEVAHATVGVGACVEAAERGW
jgi:hypothetical protein